jgi:hypothetical protein
MLLNLYETKATEKIPELIPLELAILKQGATQFSNLLGRIEKWEPPYDITKMCQQLEECILVFIALEENYLTRDWQDEHKSLMQHLPRLQSALSNYDHQCDMWEDYQPVTEDSPAANQIASLAPSFLGSQSAPTFFSTVSEDTSGEHAKQMTPP